MPDTLTLQALSTPLSAVQLRPFVETALLEDLAQGDITSDNLPEMDRPGQGTVVSRQAGVVSGIEVAEAVFLAVDPRLQVDLTTSNGDSIKAGQPLLTISGSLLSMVKAERTALNILQHLCGVATITRQFAEKLAGTSAKVCDTRKTTPGLRLLEKRAVVHGGGSPHRYNLGSAVMVKDNHVAAMGGLTQAVSALKSRIGHTVKIEAEADSLAQVAEALAAGVDIILLDNMPPEQVREAVGLINGRAMIEASGNISLQTIRAYAEAGAQYLSTSKITLGAPALDIGLDFD